MKSELNAPLKSGNDVEGGIGISTVKVGAEGKEKAVLIRKSASKWIFLFLGLLLGGGGGAAYVYRTRQMHQLEMDKLTRLLRSTGERVGALHRVQDRLEESKVSSEVKEELAKELKLGSEVGTARSEHERAQAAMMKAGSPSQQDQEAADKAAKQVPKQMQAKMVEEFRLKAGFLVWATESTRDVAWRKSPRFNKEPTPELVAELDNLEDLFEDASVDTAVLISWLRGNISAGNYPPPISSLGGIAGYIEDLTDEPSLFIKWEDRKKSRASAHQEAFKAAEQTIHKMVALSADEITLAKDPTPTFKGVYAALVQYHLTEWLFPSDDPLLEEGNAKEFYAHKDISEEEEDDDDDEDTPEYLEDDDDESDEDTE